MVEFHTGRFGKNSADLAQNTLPTVHRGALRSLSHFLQINLHLFKHFCCAVTCFLLINFRLKYAKNFIVQNTGELRYLEFQGNGENTSSLPKFEIANYDVTRIHVHEQKCVHFRLELS